MDWISLIQTVITAITSVIIALIGAGYFKKMQDKKDEKKSREKLVEQIQKDEVIHFTLREIRRRFNSDRIYVIQFHNGGYFYSKNPMQKASVTYERNSDGLERVGDKFQNILGSNYTWYLGQMMVGKMFYTNLDDQMEDLPTMSLLKNYGNYAHTAVPIYDDAKNLIATLALSWVFSPIPSTIIKNDNFSDEFKEELYNDANSLRNYLV
jgi:hypothetical protein